MVIALSCELEQYLIVWWINYWHLQCAFLGENPINNSRYIHTDGDTSTKPSFYPGKTERHQACSLHVFTLPSLCFTAVNNYSAITGCFRNT